MPGAAQQRELQPRASAIDEAGAALARRPHRPPRFHGHVSTPTLHYPSAAPRLGRNLARVAAPGLGTIVALWARSWPDGAAEAAWTALAGAVAGLLLCVAGEHVIGLRAEARRVQGIERQLEAERAQMDLQLRQAAYRVQVAQRESAINAVWLEVYAGVYREAAEHNVIVPSPAVLARVDVNLKAKNLDKPLPDFTP
jgi:hypothetical protein